MILHSDRIFPIALLRGRRSEVGAPERARTSKACRERGGREDSRATERARMPICADAGAPKRASANEGPRAPQDSAYEVRTSKQSWIVAASSAKARDALAATVAAASAAIFALRNESWHAKRSCRRTTISSAGPRGCPARRMRASVATLREDEAPESSWSRRLVGPRANCCPGSGIS